jgi:hypothetical protein
LAEWIRLQLGSQNLKLGEDRPAGIELYASSKKDRRTKLPTRPPGNLASRETELIVESKSLQDSFFEDVFLVEGSLLRLSDFGSEILTDKPG